MHACISITSGIWTCFVVVVVAVVVLAVDVIVVLDIMLITSLSIAKTHTVLLFFSA